MRDSAIEWTDHTFNPWVGCTKVSPGCVNCYAEARDVRFYQGKHWGKGAPRQRTASSNWAQPLAWNRQCRELQEIGTLKRNQRVFCASLADWLDDEVPIEWLADLLKLIHATPNLDWLLLSKRPQNWLKRMGDAVAHLCLRNQEVKWLFEWRDGNPPQNIWIGTTVEDQKRADERIPEVLKIPAKVRFLSVEPMLEGIDLHLHDYNYGAMLAGPDHAPCISWVIVGGESGSKKRSFNCDWARSIRTQCEEAGSAFFMKQIDKVKSIPEDLLIREFPEAGLANR